MASELIDLNAPARDPATPKPRGTLPVFPAVEEIVARETLRLAPYMTDEAERRIRDDLTLQHYCEGSEVAYRRTSSGVEVLAVRCDEIKDDLRATPHDPRCDV